MRYNIALLGKSGVGKSTLINYLFGDNVRGTSNVKPCTEIGFHKNDIVIKGIPVTIFDSGGLEADKSNLWKDTLQAELSKRTADNPIEEWFHTVIYCFGAGGARIEDFEINTIRDFLNTGYKLIVVFTKADQASQHDLEEMTRIIRSDTGENIPAIPICSEEKELLGGRKTERFGKEELEEKIINLFHDSVLGRVPDRCFARFDKVIDYWKMGVQLVIREKVGYFNSHIVSKNLQENADRFRERLPGLLKEEMEQEIAKIWNLFTYLETLYPLTFEKKFKDISFDIPMIILSNNIADWWDVFELINAFGSFMKMLKLIFLGGVRKKIELMVSVERFCNELQVEIRKKVHPLVTAVLEEIFANAKIG